MENISKWMHSRTGWLVGAIVEVLLAYGFGSLAIDTGMLIFYALTLVSVGAVVVSLANTVKSK